ncbi:FAD-dependent oxidoreductase [soil metagenome]
MITDLKTIGSEATAQLVSDRWNGLQKLRNRLGDKNIDYQNLGGFELIRPHEIECLEEISTINSILHPIFKQQVYKENQELIQEFGFNADLVKTIIYNPLEGQLDTGKMMKNLLELAQSLKIDIYTGSEVIEVTDTDSVVKIDVNSRFYNKNITFQATGVAVCTNAFTEKIIKNIELKAGRGLVLATEPIPDLKIKGAFHFQEGFYYFRNFENRIIFGGGRNLDLEKETSTEFLVNEKILDILDQYLQEIIIPGKTYSIAHLWTGIMAFGDTKQPVIKKISDRVVAGVRLGGMGVAIGSLVGEQVANLLVE